MCRDLFSEETPLTVDSSKQTTPVLQETTKSSHFGWSVMGGSTVCLIRAEVDPGEGPGGSGARLIFRPN